MYKAGVWVPLCIVLVPGYPGGRVLVPLPYAVVGSVHLWQCGDCRRFRYYQVTDLLYWNSFQHFIGQSRLLEWFIQSRPLEWSIQSRLLKWSITEEGWRKLQKIFKKIVVASDAGADGWQVLIALLAPFFCLSFLWAFCHCCTRCCHAAVRFSFY